MDSLVELLSQLLVACVKRSWIILWLWLLLPLGLLEFGSLLVDVPLDESVDLLGGQFLGCVLVYDQLLRHSLLFLRVRD